MTCWGLAVVVVVVDFAVVTVTLGVVGAGVAGLAAAVVGVTAAGVTAAGADVSTGAGAVVSGAAGAVALTAPSLLADFAGLDPEPHAAPARVRASRPATRPVRNGRFMVLPPTGSLVS